MASRVTAVPTAVILTIGNELVSGDIANTNGSWLAQRLERLGLGVTLMAAVPDVEELIVDFVRRYGPDADILVVTGGLGGTPDDITRESLAAAFGVGQAEVPELAADLRARFTRNPDNAARWANLPVGSRPLANPLGGAPGFALANVYVLPGLPAEMEAMWEALEPELAHAAPIGSWRRRYRTYESQILAVLEGAVERFPAVNVGSYPSFGNDAHEVEIVLKSSDAAQLAQASGWVESEVALLLD